MVTLSPHQITDKNGKQTTVYRRDYEPPKNALARLGSVGAAKKIPQKFVGQEFPSEVATRPERNVFSSDPDFTKRLSELTGWQVVALGQDDDNQPVDGDYLPSDGYWGWMGVRTPDGLLVDANGVFTEQEVMRREKGSPNERILEVRPEDFDEAVKGVESIHELGSLDSDITISKIHEHLFDEPLVDWRITTDDVEWVDVNGEKFALQTDGCSTMACWNCGTFYAPGVEDVSWTDTSFCQQCGVVADTTLDTFAIEHDSQQYVDEKVTLEATWYHATVVENWDSAILSSENTPFVHLGTKETALDRAKFVKHHARDKDKPIYLYEVRFKPGTSISPDIHEDANEWPEAVAEGDLYGFDGEGVNRYLNRYEKPGSMSLIVNPQSFEVSGLSTLD